MTTAGLKENMAAMAEYFASTANEAETALIEKCRNCDDEHARQALAYALKISRLRCSSQRALAAVQDRFDMPTYFVSTMFLKDAFGMLNKGPEEDARFATGIWIPPNCYTLDRLLEFRLAIKSVTAAEGEQSSVNRVLIALHEANHKLHATFHIHPGDGPGATAPSRIDLDLHRRLEKGSYPAIGCVFSRHGYLRFFSHKRQFKVSVYGKGVDRVDEQQTIYHVSEVPAAPEQGLLTWRVWPRGAKR